MKFRKDEVYVSVISDKRMDILNACIEVFSKKDYYKATIEDIASQAGVGKGTVYLYFSGKEDLFEEMLKYILCKYHDELGDILSKDESIKERIVNLVEFFKKCVGQHMDLIQIIISEYAPMPSDKVKTIFKQKRCELAGVLSKFMNDGIESGEIRKDIDKYIASLCMFSTIQHYYLDKTQSEELEIEDIDDKPLIEFIINMFK